MIPAATTRPSTCCADGAGSRYPLVAPYAEGRTLDLAYQVPAHALGLFRLGALALGVRLSLGARIELAAHQFDLRDFRSVALAEPQPQQARVAAGPAGEPRRERVEQLGHHFLILQVVHDQPPRVQRFAVRAALHGTPPL